MKVIEPLERRLDTYLIAIMKDGSYNTIPNNRVIVYDTPERAKDKTSGVGMDYRQIARELQEHGDIHIARGLNPQGPYEVLKSDDIFALYAIDRNSPQIVPPKRGWRKIVWRLSML